MSIYEVTQDLIELDGKIEDAGGELTDELLEDYLALNEDLDKNILSGAAWMKNKQEEAKMIGWEIDRLTKRKKALVNRHDRFKEFLANTYFARKGKGTIKDELFTVTVSETPPSVVVQDDAKIPKSLLTPQPAKYNKTDLKLYIESGKTIKGVSLESHPTISIR